MSDHSNGNSNGEGSDFEIVPPSPSPSPADDHSSQGLTWVNTSTKLTDSIQNGHAVQVVITKDDHSFELDEEALSNILMKDTVKQKPVAVISVSGAFRKGKSFLLDFFLRYLKAEDKEHWLGSEDQPLEGFSWRGGCERDTTGILMWSEPFLITIPSGQEVAVILMDTQGAFDSQSTVRDCATVFALSTMLSSIQIFNLSQNIQEDDLQHLQLFTEYGRLALEDCGDKPFQKLHFLVRDWSFPYDVQYGKEGGQQILERRLEISDRQHPELQSLRRHIKNCFNDISCFLMPHPGLKVATNPKFDGRLRDIEQDFKDQLAILVPLLLAPENLVVKEINGVQVKAKELLHYFKAYIDIYHGHELPEPKSMLEATAEANNLAAVAGGKDLYIQEMEFVCGGDKPYLNPSSLEREHARALYRAMDHFKSRKKMGGPEFSGKYHDRLQAEILETYAHYQSQNEGKNFFKAGRTPGVLILMIMLFYFVSSFFSFLGLFLISNIFNVLWMLCFLSFGIWAYSRYSGEFREVGNAIDGFVTNIWEGALHPVYSQFVEERLQEAVQNATVQLVRTNSSLTQLTGGVSGGGKGPQGGVSLSRATSIEGGSQLRQRTS